MTRFSGPVWRLAGAATSWTLFIFCFTLLYQVSSVVTGLGGFCASGGPYEISVECPESVVLFAPLSIIGGFIAGGIALFFARGFAAPLVSWAWPILFVGLGILFAVSTVAWGSIVYGVLALLFLAMGLVPVVVQWRHGLRPVLLGPASITGERFGDEVTATPGDWALGVGIPLGSIALGVWLGILAFTAVATAA